MVGSDHAGSTVVRDCDRTHGAAPVTAVVWAQEEAMFPVVSVLMVSACRYIVRHAASGTGRQYFSPVHICVWRVYLVILIVYCVNLVNTAGGCAASCPCADLLAQRVRPGLAARLVPLVHAPPLSLWVYCTIVRNVGHVYFRSAPNNCEVPETGCFSGTKSFHEML